MEDGQEFFLDSVLACVLSKADACFLADFGKILAEQALLELAKCADASDE